MGRYRKQGFSYFPFDVDFFSDIKIRKLIKNNSSQAVSIYLCVLTFIYESGYYVVNDRDLGFVISEKTGCKESMVEAVLSYCVAIGLFSDEMYKKGVFTSKSIQERYLQMCKASRRIVLISEYSLISSEEIPISSEEIPISSEETTQKKSKVKSIITENNTLYGEFSSKIPRERKQEPTQESKTENTLTLKPEEEPLSKSSAKKFSLVWNAFAGKKNNIEKDFKKFQEKTKGLEVDFDKLLREAKKSKNIYFQSWLKDFFPKATKKENGNFIPPTTEQVRNYCNERQNGISPEEFCDFYQSKNWMVGPNKMKDWEAAIRNWEHRRKKENGKQNPLPNQPNNGKVSGTTEILNGIRYFEAT